MAALVRYAARKLRSLRRRPAPQAAGLRAPVAVLPERVIDGVTGSHHSDPERFADAAVSILTDDALWRRQHEAALRHQQGIGWSEQAGRLEAALLGDRVALYRSVLDVPDRS